MQSIFSNTDLQFQIISGHVLIVLKSIPDESIQTCITSPPYLGLRNYGTKEQIWGGDENCPHDFSINYYCRKCPAWLGNLGLEPSPELFIRNLTLIFREVRRVLTPNGTLWLNLGDTYYGGKGRSGSGGKEHQQLRFRSGRTISHPHSMVGGHGKFRPQDRPHAKLKPKDLIGIPWQTAFALRDDGWWLRQDCIWHKPNPLPESVKDRCTKSHEYIFLFSKSRRYFFDSEAIDEPAKYDGRGAKLYKGSKKYQCPPVPFQPAQSFHGRTRERWRYNRRGEIVRRKRSVWTIPTNQAKSNHTAAFPEKLIEPCVLAGSAPGDFVLDIFSGTATVGVSAIKNQRKYVGIELNPEHVEFSQQRLHTILNYEREKDR